MNPKKTKLTTKQRQIGISGTPHNPTIHNKDFIIYLYCTSKNPIVQDMVIKMETNPSYISVRYFLGDEQYAVLWVHYAILCE